MTRYRADPEYRAKVIERGKGYSRIKRYGITPQNFVEMAEAQNWKCPITGEFLTMSSHVDHCHETGIVRGILSPRANKLLGHAKDNISVLESAVRFLKETDRLKSAVGNNEQRGRVSSESARHERADGPVEGDVRDCHQ